MNNPSVLLLRTAGINCDEETKFAFEQAGARVHPVHVRALCERPALLDEHAILVFPGGFSYGDDLGSGVVLAHEIAQRLREPLSRFVERGGLVIGICNGFQVLVKTGLLPGADYDAHGKGGGGAACPAATLTFNDSRRFEDRWVVLRVEPSRSPFLAGAAGRLVAFPVAHGEGKFVTRDTKTLRRLKADGLVAFRYVSAEGGMAAYPANPNGSPDDIAGITDAGGRVLGLMPHPERHVLPWQHPAWTRGGPAAEGDGVFIFRNAVNHAHGKS